MKCLTDEHIEQLQAEARRATVQAAVEIILRRHAAACTTGQRDLLRVAGEVEALPA